MRAIVESALRQLREIEADFKAGYACWLTPEGRRLMEYCERRLAR